MATRFDYFDDPSAPPPNSLVPAANVIVNDDRGAILLIRRTDNGTFALPGGAMDLGESLTATAVRECKEETGYDIEIDGLVGIFTDPGHVIHYISNDEVRQEFAVVFMAHVVGGEARPSSEAADLVWIDRSELAAVSPMSAATRLRIETFLAGVGPRIDPP